METKIFKREKKEDKPVVAICYDFDKTLSPDDMQAQGFIQSIGQDVTEFWRDSNSLAQENDMDQNLAYMLKMINKSKGNFYVTKEKLEEYGSKVKLFKGVLSWFERIKEYGEKKNVIVEHYIISSGLKEMIEGTKMAKKGVFKRIYASSYYYDQDGVASWPAQVVNYTNKTQFLFRIEKGVLDINDDSVNEFFPPEEVRIPFRNIVYIGDSATDIPCMKLVNVNGGYSIGVYNPESKDKTKVYSLIEQNRIKYYAPADYSENSLLDQLVKNIIDKTVENEKLENIYYKNINEVEKEKTSRGEKVKNALIVDLLNSRSFASTHTIIAQMNEIENWTDLQVEAILLAAINNGQVKSIINDCDVKQFYMRLVNNHEKNNKYREEIIKMFS